MDLAMVTPDHGQVRQIIEVSMDLNITNTDPTRTALTVGQNTGATTGNDAVAIYHGTAAGNGTALRVTSVNSSAAPVIVQGSGDLLSLRNVSGTEVYKVTQTGSTSVSTLSVTASETISDATSPAAGALSVGVAADRAAGGGASTSALDVRSTSAAVEAAYIKYNPPGGTATTHALTVRQAGTTSDATTGSAVNVTSDNTAFTAFQVSGKESARGTIKCSHLNNSGSATGDANAAAISIDLQQNAQGGTAARGIFVTSSDGGTTGDLMTLRNGGTDLYTVASDGSVYTAASAFGAFQPVQHGLVSWTFSPELAISTSLPTGGTIYLCQLNVSKSTNVTKIYWHVGVAASGVTSGQNFVGLYDHNGTLVQAVGIDSDIISTGLKTTTISQYTVVHGLPIYVAFLLNASTTPGLARGTGVTGAGGLINVGLSAANYRYAANSSLQTSLSNVTLSANAQGISFWAAIG